MYHRGRVFQSCGFAPPAERERKTIGLFISQEDVGRLLAHVSNNCETPSEKCQDYHDQWCRHAAGAVLQEKGSIAATAQHIAGTNNVDNQLEIKGY